ncbi:MAG: hypothetical protein JWM84_503 [Nocardioides sp.]|jgi:ABC-type transport system involved in multi-copper enzyme maturation permease subunit|nr:hypothetical protein [Nocardioides sp.]
MSAQASPFALDVSGTAPIPFSRLVAVELRKSYNTRAAFWLLGAIVIIVALAEGIVTAIIVVQGGEVSWGDFIGVAAFLTSFLLPVLGIMLVTSEWGQRTAMVTFALEPQRSKVILAKLAVGLILALATALVAIVIGAGCTVICELFQGETTSWDFGMEYFVGFVVTQMLAMVGGFALAALLLNTPAAIVLFFVYYWALPIIFGVGAALLSWFAELAPYINLREAQAPITDWSLSGGEEWAQLVVSSLIWIAVPIAFGMTRILRAEVK